MAGNYLFRAVKDENGDFLYEYEGEIHPETPEDTDAIYPALRLLPKAAD